MVARCRGLVVGFALAGFGCGPVVGRGDDGRDSDGGTGASSAGSTSSASTSSPATTTTGAPSTGTIETTATTEGSDTSSDGGSFVVETGMVGWECSTFVREDCPSDRKCMPFDAFGDGTWSEAECFPLDPDAGSLGEPCSVVGGPASGLDDCAEGSMCFHVDPDDTAGTCVAFCDGELDSPICKDPERVCTDLNDHVLSLCLSMCDPTDPAACAAGHGCVPVGHGDRFACILMREAAASPGEPCRWANDCAPGSACLAPQSLSACDPGDAAGCCAPYCDPTLAEPQCGASPDSCQPISRFIGAGEWGICAATAFDELAFVDWIAP